MPPSQPPFRGRTARSDSVGIRRPRVAGRPASSDTLSEHERDQHTPLPVESAGPKDAPSEATSIEEPIEEKRTPESEVPDSGPAGDATDVVEVSGKSGERQRTLTGVLLAVGVVLTAVAVFFGIQYFAIDTGNTAYSDAATTRQVSTQVSTSLNTLLAFDYRQPDKNAQAARNLIAGKLADCDNSDKVGYEKLMDVLRQQGPAQKLVVTSAVQRIGVRMLQGDGNGARAQLLVLLVQSYTKGDGAKAQNSAALAAATVDAVRQGGSWKLQALCLQ